MSMHKIVTGIVGLVAVIGLLLGLASLGSEQVNAPSDGANDGKLGATGIFHQLFHIFGSGAQIGDDGSEVSDIIEGTCNLESKQLPLEASSTDMFYCTVTGAESGDKVFISLPDYNLNQLQDGALGYFTVTSAGASTTDTIDVALTNLNGIATSSFPLATTSVKYFIIR